MEHDHAAMLQTSSVSSGFMPHGHCYLWQPGLVWTHVISDLLIGLAYLSISLTLYFLVRKIRLPFSPVFIAFGAFIGACGLTHFMEIWNLWHADYWAGGGIKVVTAVASVVTGAALFPIKPKVVALAEAARLSEERKVKLESAHAELGTLYEKVKQSDQLKTEFFANVSHELRTPLSLILGPVEELLHDRTLSDDQRQKLDVVSRNSKTLLMQVNDLLDISKLEAGRLRPRYVRADVVKLFRFVTAHFETIMQSKSIFFSLQSPEAIQAEVDPDKLQRIYMNLLSNAVKFTPKGGRIRATIKQESESFAFLIEDTGPGVDASVADFIFERFRQGEGGANRKVGGTGLGLAIVKDFTEMHGGKVSLLEGHAPGATFIVTLPKNAPEGVDVSSEADLVPELSQVMVEGTVAQLRTGDPVAGELAHRPGLPSVLVCEDNPDMNRFVVETLAPQFNVSRAVDGAEGLAKAQALRPDLIVSDIMMPHVSGDELVRAVKQDEALRHIPILLLSARSDDDMRVALLKEGAADYLVKPFAPDELRVRAGNLVAMKRVRDVLTSELEVKSHDIVDLATKLAERRHEAELATEVANSAREVAEKASKVKSEFLGLISHELNTPLTAIGLVAQLLHRRERESLSPKQQELIDRLVSSSGQMKALVEGLLEHVRAGGEQAQNFELCDVRALAIESIESLKALAHGKGIDLRAELPAHECLQATDPTKIRVILNNLLVNAIKFTDHGEVELSLRWDDGSREIRVRDTGPGIKAEDRERIFKPFEQIGRLDRKSVPGIGLGLALVKQLITTIGASIKLESDGESGSTFIVGFEKPARV